MQGTFDTKVKTGSLFSHLYIKKGQLNIIIIIIIIVFILTLIVNYRMSYHNNFELQTAVIKQPCKPSCLIDMTTL